MSILLRKCLPWLGCLLAAVSLPGADGNVLDELIIEEMTGGLVRPTGMAYAPDGSGRLFITQQEGAVVIYDGSGLRETPFLACGLEGKGCGEQGLLSIVFHPDYRENRYFYVYYTAKPDGRSIVSRFEVSDDPNMADPATEKIILELAQPSPSHNAGQLHFGRDGYLYIALGDGGPDRRQGQDLGSLYGSILRIDVDGGDPYAIPPSNPFVDDPDARGEIWVYGLRNPWRFTFDRLTGDMYIGDVGNRRSEEIDFQPALSPGGENYGWGFMEGRLCFPPDTPCDPENFAPPLFEYRRTEEPCASAIAGFRYRGREFPQLNGVYFYADHCLGEEGKLFAARQDENGEWVELGERNIPHFLSSFGENESGEIYFLDHDQRAGSLHRITAQPPVAELSRLSPPDGVAGGRDFTLTLAGANFVPNSQVRWNGQPLPATYLDSGRLQATVSAAAIRSPGTARLSVFNPDAGEASAEIDFAVQAAPADPPAINPGGVVEGAGFMPGLGVAPGSIVSVFGGRLAVDDLQVATAVPLPELLGGVTLLFDGEHEAPLFAATPRQVNIQIPWELEGASEAQLEAFLGPHVSGERTVPITPFSPGIFSKEQNGGGQGAILIAGPGGALAAPQGAFENSRPARRGEFIEIFATGLGPVTNQPPTGEPATATPASLAELSRTLHEVAATIGGEPAEVHFSGLAPGLVGLYQVTAQVPASVSAGDAVPVELTIEGVRSNQVSVAIAGE